MVKVDLKDAYFTIPIHHLHQQLLRFTVKGMSYQFTCPPFGLSCAPWTFIKVMNVWEEQLKSHPDSRFVSLLLQGLANGFNIGFNPTLPRRSAKTNLMSALDHPEIVSAYIEEELGQRNISLVGRLEDAKHLDIHISLLGSDPQKG